MQKTAEFEKRIGKKMEGWWIGLTGRIDEGLLEIMTIDEEQKNEKTDSEGTTDREEDQIPDKRGTGIKLFICYKLLYAHTMYLGY